MSGLGRALSFLAPSNMIPLLDMAPKRLPRPAELAKPGVIAAVGSKRLRVALLTGCAQSVLGPQINDATVRLLTRLGAEVVIPNDTGCCGALTFHMGERRQSRKLMGHMIHRETKAMDWMRLCSIRRAVRPRCASMNICSVTIQRSQKKPKLGRARARTGVIAELGLGEIGESSGLRIAYHDACSYSMVSI